MQVLRNCVKLTDVGLAKLAGLSGRELPQLWVSTLDLVFVVVVLMRYQCAAQE